MENKIMRCVIYARQSRTREGSESIETQLEACRLAAERFGFEVVRILAEPPSTSGYKNRGKNRAQFKILLDGFIQGDWEMVMAYKTDRLSRGGGPGWAPLFEAIEKANLDLDRAVATPSGFVSEFEIGIRATMDREESKKLSDRMSDIAIRKASQGLPQGGRRPYGYQDDLVSLHPTEAPLLQEMARKVLNGHSFRKVAQWMNEQGYHTTTGKFFYPLTVRNLMLNPRYAAIRAHGGKSYPAIWEPALDAETWEQLQTTMLLRAASPDTPKPRRYMLTGTLYCGICSSPLNGMTKRDKADQPLRRTYQCRFPGDALRKRGCGGVTRNADALDHWVKESVLAHLESANLLELLGATGEEASLLRDLLDQRRAQQQRLDQLVDDYATGALNRAQWDRAKAAAEAELKRIGALVTRYASTHTVLSMLPSERSVRDAWSEEPDDWKANLIASLVERINVNPGITKPFYEVDGKFMRFDPTLIEIEWRTFGKIAIDQ